MGSRLALLLVWSLVLFTGTAHGQKVRSLQDLDEELHSLASTAREARSLLLSERAMVGSRSNPARAVEDARRALELAREAFSDQARARALNALGESRSRSGKFLDSGDAHGVALELARATGSTRDVGIALIGLARCALHTGDLQRTSELLDQAAETLGTEGADSDLSSLHNLYAVWHQSRYELRQALEEYIIALRHAEAAEDLPAQSRLHYNLGTVQANMDDVEGAELSFRRALELNEGEASSQYTGLLYSVLGEFALDRDDRGEARRRFEAGRDLAEEAGNLGITALHLRNLAAMAVEDGQLEEALRGYEESLELSRREDNREAMATSSVNVARVLSMLGRTQEALEVGEGALGLAAELEMPVTEMDVTRVMSEIYVAAGDHERALEVQQRFTDTALAMESEMRSAETNRLRLEIERAQREQDRAEEQRIADARLERERRNRNLSVAGTFTLVVVLALVYRNSRSKSRMNALLEEQNHAIAETNQTVLGLNADLEKTLEEVRRLSGLLPICCHCKSIRDDEGYWLQVERYITENSEAEFSHGICPECLAQHYSVDSTRN